MELISKYSHTLRNVFVCTYHTVESYNNILQPTAGEVGEKSSIKLGVTTERNSRAAPELYPGS